MKDFSDVVIIRHPDSRFVGKTGYALLQGSDNKKCYVGLDKPIWTINEDGISELIDFCYVNVENLKKIRSSDKWKEYTFGFMERFL